MSPRYLGPAILRLGPTKQPPRQPPYRDRDAMPPRTTSTLIFEEDCPYDDGPASEHLSLLIQVITTTFNQLDGDGERAVTSLTGSEGRPRSLPLRRGEIRWIGAGK